MQEEALRRVFFLEEAVKATDNPRIIEDWRKMTTSDHFYYMCTKYWSDGDVHKYFSPYDTPLDACLLYTSPSPRDRTRSRMPSSA